MPERREQEANEEDGLGVLANNNNDLARPRHDGRLAVERVIDALVRTRRPAVRKQLLPASGIPRHPLRQWSLRRKGMSRVAETPVCLEENVGLARHVPELEDVGALFRPAP